MRGPIEFLHDTRARVGESPVWDAENRCLYWVDILGPTVFRIDPVTRDVRSWPLPSAVGSIGLCDDGRIAVALTDGVRLLDPETGALEFLVDPEPDMPTNRLNDGKVGPDGAFWVGSMDDRPTKEPVAALHRVTRDGRATKVLDGLIISNGLAWSGDGRTMYHSDSRGPWIDRWDFDPATGAISNRTRIATLTNEEGRPDGGAVDADGVYWSCGVSAGVINRFDRDGKLLERIPLPVSAPTACAFGGEDMRTLFITSLREHQPPEKLAAFPQGGGLHMMRVDVPGVPVGRFR